MTTEEHNARVVHDRLFDALERLYLIIESDTLTDAERRTLRSSVEDLGTIRRRLNRCIPNYT